MAYFNLSTMLSAFLVCYVGLVSAVNNTTFTSLNVSNSTSPPVLACDTTCVHHLLYKTAYASASNGIIETIRAYDSVSWCTVTNANWCPEIINTTSSTIAADTKAAIMIDYSDCDDQCLLSAMTTVSRNAALSAISWAEQSVVNTSYSGRSVQKLHWTTAQLENDTTNYQASNVSQLADVSTQTHDNDDRNKALAIGLPLAVGGSGLLGALVADGLCADPLLCSSKVRPYLSSLLKGMKNSLPGSDWLRYLFNKARSGSTPSFADWSSRASSGAFGSPAVSSDSVWKPTLPTIEEEPENWDAPELENSPGAEGSNPSAEKLTPENDPAIEPVDGSDAGSRPMSFESDNTPEGSPRLGPQRPQIFPNHDSWSSDGSFASDDSPIYSPEGSPNLGPAPDRPVIPLPPLDVGPKAPSPYRGHLLSNIPEEPEDEPLLPPSDPPGAIPPNVAHPGVGPSLSPPVKPPGLADIAPPAIDPFAAFPAVAPPAVIPPLPPLPVGDIFRAERFNPVTGRLEQQTLKLASNVAEGAVGSTVGVAGALAGAGASVLKSLNPFHILYSDGRPKTWSSKNPGVHGTKQIAWYRPDQVKPMEGQWHQIGDRYVRIDHGKPELSSLGEPLVRSDSGVMETSEVEKSISGDKTFNLFDADGAPVIDSDGKTAHVPVDRLTDMSYDSSPDHRLSDQHRPEPTEGHPTATTPHATVEKATKGTDKALSTITVETTTKAKPSTLVKVVKSTESIPAALPFGESGKHTLSAASTASSLSAKKSDEKTASTHSSSVTSASGKKSKLTVALPSTKSGKKTTSAASITSSLSWEKSDQKTTSTHASPTAASFDPKNGLLGHLTYKKGGKKSTSAAPTTSSLSSAESVPRTTSTNSALTMSSLSTNSSRTANLSTGSSASNSTSATTALSTLSTAMRTSDVAMSNPVPTMPLSTATPPLTFSGPAAVNGSDPFAWEMQIPYECTGHCKKHHKSSWEGQADHCVRIKQAAKDMWISVRHSQKASYFEWKDVPNECLPAYLSKLTPKDQPAPGHCETLKQVAYYHWRKDHKLDKPPPHHPFVWHNVPKECGFWSQFWLNAKGLIGIGRHSYKQNQIRCQAARELARAQWLKEIGYA